MDAGQIFVLRDDDSGVKGFAPRGATRSPIARFYHAFGAEKVQDGCARTDLNTAAL
jgi:hypothetical protein